MKKKIIIDSSNNAEIKKVERVSNKSSLKINNSFTEWLICMIAYSIVLLIVSKLFKSLYINTSNFGIYALLASIIIYILNQTIKPIIKFITMPITIISFGILYPLTNVIILYITSFILGNNFIIRGFWSALIVAVFISLFNILINGLIVKPIIKGKQRKYE